MSTEATKETGWSESLEKALRRVRKLVAVLNKISESRHNGAVTFTLSRDNENDEIDSPGVAISCTYHRKTVIIHACCAFDRKGLAGATLTTEHRDSRKTRWGRLDGTLIMPVLMNEDEEPTHYSVMRFDYLASLPGHVVEDREDRPTNVRVHLHKVMRGMTPIAGRDTAPITLIEPENCEDAVAYIMSVM